VVVVLLDVLEDGVVPDEELLLVSVELLLEPGVLELLMEPVPEAPIELVLPLELGDVLLVLLLPIALVLPGVVLLLELVSRFAVVEGDVVVDELEDVEGAVPSRFVQAPSEKAATMARAAHVVLDAFIRKLLEGVVRKSQRAVVP
jgi:hypothetical protein